MACEPLELRRLLNAPGTNYTLAFDDEFNGTNMAADTLWKNYLPWTTDPYEGGNYLDYMVNSNETINGVAYTSNVAESGGQLHLNTQSVASTPIVDGSNTLSYTGAMLTTNSSFSTEYGYAEIRAQLPTGQGNWPAFWSLGNGWPPENDIMEDWPTGPRFHQGLYGMDAGWHDYNDTSTTTVPSTNFHTFAMQWGPGFENFYVDGNLAYSTAANNVPAADIPSQSMYFLLNSGVAAGEVGSYTNSSTANELNVDWVRIYTYTPSPGPAIANAGFNVTGSYTLTGGASIVTGGTIGLTGTGDLHIVDTASVGEASQLVSGLTPNTTYVLSGYGEVSALGGATGLIGAQNFSSGSGNVSSAIGSSSQVAWTLGSIAFTTGPTDTSATIYVSNPNGTSSAPVYFDDLSLVTAPVMTVSGAGTTPGGTVSVPITQGDLGSFWSAASITSSNTALVANTGITLNAAKTALQISTVAGQQGTTTITLTATEGDFFTGSVSSSFVLTVLPTEAITGNGTADAIRLVRDGSMVDVYVNNVTTTPTSQFSYSSFAVTSFSSLLAGSSLVIDYSGGDPVTPGGITWTGTGGNNSLSVINLAGSNKVFLTSGTSVLIDSDLVNYTNVANLSLDLGNGLNTLTSTSPSTTPTITLIVDSGGTTTMLGTGALPGHTILNVATGGTFGFSNQSESIDQVTGSGTVSLGSGNLTVGAQNGSSTFGGNITGTGALTKSGTGTFTLTGTSHYTGGTTVTTGVLEVAATSAIAATGVTVSAGATLNVDSGASLIATTALSDAGTTNFKNTSQTIATLNAAGRVLVNPTALTVSNGGTFSGVISGTGSLIVSGGTLNLSGVNTYSGSTTVSGGKLRVLGQAPIASYNFSNGAATNTGVGGTGMNGTLNGSGASLIASGGPLFGTGALTLNGTGSTLDVASPITDLSGSGTWTVSLWVKTTQAGATLFNKGNGSGWTTGYSTFYLGTTASGGAGAGGVPDAVRYAGGWVAGSATINTGTWQMVTFVNNAGTKSIYTNGTLVNTVSLEQGGFGTADVGTEVRFGFAADPSDGPANLNGSLSDINFYANALSATQVKSLFTSNVIVSGVTNVLPSGTQVNVTSTTAALDIEGVNQTIASLSGVAVSSVILGNGGNLTVAAGNTAFAGVISGAGSVTVSGGSQVLSGTNTYAGSTSVTGGTLELAGGSLASTGISIGSAGTLTVDSAARLATSTTLSDGGVVNFADGTQAISTLSGAGTLNLNPTSLTISAGGTFSGSINGSGGLAVTGGAVQLSGTSGYAGSTIIVGTGSLEIASPGSLAGAGVSLSTTATLTVDSGGAISSSTNLTDAGTVNFNNAGQILATLNGSGTVNLNPGMSLTVTGGGAFSGVITDPTATLIVSGGSLVLSGASTYSGDTDITSGSLEIASPGSLASININVSGGAILTVDSGGAISSSTNLSNAGTVNFNDVGQTIATLNGSGALNLSGTALTISGGGTFSGPIGGAGALTIAGGVLTLTSAGTIAATAITVNASATADINGIFTAMPAVTVNGNLNLGAADATNDPTSVILVRNLGSLTVGTGGDIVVGLASSNATRSVLTTTDLSNVGGTLDLTNNDMIAFGGDPSAVSGDVNSSSAAADPTLMTLAVYQNDGEFGTFDTQTVSPGDVLVKYTFFGDADLSGTVNASDYSLIDNGFNSQGNATPLTGWLNGDFNGDGVINGDDYTLIDNAFNSQSVAAPMATPAEVIAPPAAPKANPFSAGPVVSFAPAGQDSVTDAFGELKKRGHKIATDILV